MTSALKCGLIFLALSLVGTARIACADEVLLNASYDVAREFYNSYNPLFEATYKQKTGQSISVNQSHGGSSAQARAVIDGLAADVVTMNQASDLTALADKGLVSRDWATQFPFDASPTYSTMVFVVRKGNPKAIHDWDDLARPGIQVIMVNPKIGGNGRYAYLGAWGYAKKKGQSDVQAAQFVGKILGNVPVLDAGGRAATTTFVQRGIGDVLVTFESEVVQIDREFGAGKVEAAYPSISILAENPVAIVNPVVDRKGTRAAAKAYLDGLYSEPAQKIAAEHYLRVRSPAVTAQFAAVLKPIPLFTVDEMFGGWANAQRVHFSDGGQFDRLMSGLGKR